MFSIWVVCLYEESFLLLHSVQYYVVRVDAIILSILGVCAAVVEKV